MVTARRPAVGATVSILASRAVVAGESVPAQDVATALDALIARLLEPNPERRPGLAAEVAEQLRAIAATPQARRAYRRLLPATAAVMAVVAGIGWWLHTTDTFEARPAASLGETRPLEASASSSAAPNGLSQVSVASVAVLPFANLTGEPDKDYFGEGFAEELTNQLAKIPEMKVASRTSSFAYKGKNVDVRQIAKELGVATVIEGSVRSAADRIRLTAQLINAESGYQLWSETYDRDFKDLFKLQDDLTRSIVDTFRRTMSIDPSRLVRPFKPTTANVDAYVLYLRSIQGSERYSPETSRRSVEYLKQALRLDPNFAHAEALLALIISNFPETPLAEVEQHARHANELDPMVGRDMLLNVEARRGRRMEAEQLFRSLPTEAIDPTTYTYHATSVLWPLGKLQEGLREYTSVVAIAPEVPGAVSNLARFHAMLGHEGEAERLAARAAELGQDVTAWQTHEVYYQNALHGRRYDDAGRIAAEFLPRNLRNPDNEATIRLLHVAIDDTTRRAAARNALNALLGQATPADVVLKSFALGWYSQIGALDEAYKLADDLRRQFGNELPTRAWAWLWYPQMTEFRRDGRFQPFVTSLGMIPYWEKYGPPDACKLDGGRLTCE